MIKLFFRTAMVVMLVGVVQNADGDDWNQWLGPRRDGVWRESGIIKAIPADGLKVVWRMPIAGGFSGPSVAGDRVFVSDYVLKDGDQTFNAGRRSKLKGIERLHCLDRKTGKELWVDAHDRDYNISYALGPRATPTVDGEHVYTLGAEGHLICLNVEDGKAIWNRDLKKDFGLKEAQIWGFASHPLIAGDLLYCVVGGTDSVAVAFNKNTGEEVWRSISAKAAGYCPPTMINAGGEDQLLIWDAEALNSVNPKTGELYWSVKNKVAWDMAIVAPVQYGDFLLLTGVQGASMLLKLDAEKPGATEIWRGKGLHPDHNPAVVFEDHIYGVDVKGHLRCIELESGNRVWASLATAPGGRPASSTTGFVVRNGEHWYITTGQGELIIAKMSPAGYEELGRARMVVPTSETNGRKIVWSYPAFADKCVFVRNDKEIVCYSLAE